MQSFIQKKKKKTLNLGRKVPYLHISGLWFNKKSDQVFNCDSYLPKHEAKQYHPKQKNNILGTKNTRFGYFGWNVETVLSHLQGMYSNISSSKD